MTEAEKKAANAAFDKVIRYLRRRNWGGMASEIAKMKYALKTSQGKSDD